ncbi:Gfo/Idh/MocA family protein [Marisediminicola senii]|uniref:Gfo/Idh/MocA family protein n=1 Tax=Marisediminicola senii TaxID=2711233 RepID=UPI001F2F0545|nr:Gfo/Idh/MocA family oxidoreductase [Marisediminicola senii]
MTAPRTTLNVAMIGHGFMGAAHSQAWRTAPRFYDLAIEPRMHTLVGRDPERVAAAADKFGWDNTDTDWRRVVESDDIDIVDIGTPGDTHAEIALAALAAGKHVMCEKPLANSVADAERMTAAAADADARGVRSMVGFSYRRVPAVAFARQLVADGRIGEVRQARAQYLQDWLADAEAPLTWRLNKELAGSGSLGDIGAHAIDLVQYITAQSVAEVSGILHTFVTERPLLGEGSGLSGTASTERGPVTVDDVALFTARLEAPGAAPAALATFEATRFATGRKNAVRVEINGSLGSVAFDLERMNELDFYDATLPATELGFRRILVTEPEHPYMAAWWPTGHTIGYEHAFSHQVRDFLTSIAEGRPAEPSFSEGLQIQRVLDAIETSAGAGSAWTAPEPAPGSTTGAPVTTTGVTE